MTVYKLRALLETHRGHEEVRIQLGDSGPEEYTNLTVIRVYEDNGYNVVLKVEKNGDGR